MGTPDDDDDESKKGHRELLTPEPKQLGKHIQPYACATILFLAFILMVLFGLHDLASGWHNHVDHSDFTYTSAGRPKNVIFMVSDGFGEASLTLARTYKNTVLEPQPVAASKQPAEHVPLYLDTFNVGSAHTYSADSLLTDSAAGATAWACGLKANNGQVHVSSRQIASSPGLLLTRRACKCSPRRLRSCLQIAVTPLERPCATLMEAAKAKGMRTGLVVTSSLTDATPAAFSSHVRHRGLEHSIALQHATDRTADVLLGGGRR
jgi:alkaline phosphatase